MPGCRLVIDTRKAASYFRVSPDGTRILYGGRVAARDISPQESGPRLKDVLIRILPQLKDVGFTHSWMGYTGFTLDDLPHIGEQDGIHYAMGYCGTSGTSLGTYLGHKLGLRILGKRDAAHTAFDDLEFPSHPLYRGSTWFLSSMVAFYRMRDRIGL
jgi:glycine/D-amino acid oxidase-like deaminating enzyme